MSYSVRVVDEGVPDEKAMAAELTRLPAVMRRAARQARDFEKGVHPYNNYTGNLEKSTTAEVIREGKADALAVLEMGSPVSVSGREKQPSEYASIVFARGRSRIDEAADLLDGAIQAEIARVERLADK